MKPWNSARGHRDCRAEVRAALLASPDGMTRAQLANALGMEARVIHRVVSITPGVFVDRWAKTGPVRLTPIYGVDKFTPDCPRPD